MFWKPIFSNQIRREVLLYKQLRFYGIPDEGYINGVQSVAFSPDNQS
jgi:hypothetical protein